MSQRESNMTFVYKQFKSEQYTLLVVMVQFKSTIVLCTMQFKSEWYTLHKQACVKDTLRLNLLVWLIFTRKLKKETHEKFEQVL